MSAEFAGEEDYEDEHWLVKEYRQLKRGGSSSGGSSSRSRSGSYGNCYGDRCDNNGGDSDIAIIVGGVFGGCCVFILGYLGVNYCIEKRKKAAKKARKKNKKNRVGDSNASYSDSDAP